MKIKSIILNSLILFFIPLQFFCEAYEPGNGESYISDVLGRIGFLNEFNPDGTDPVDEVAIGVEVRGNVLYKLTTADGEIYVSAGMLSPGINSIGISVNLITGSNKGVFYLYLKEGVTISRMQIVLIPDRYEIIEKPVEKGSGEAVKDKYTHEVIVSGNNDNGIDMHNRIVMDAVTGDYPGLTQGIPVLPFLYLIGNKIYHSLKKRKKRIFPLYSQSEVYIAEDQKKGKYARLFLRIHINDM